MIQRRRIAACDAVADFPVGLEICTFETWRPRTGAQTSYEAALGFTESLSGWLVLMGHPGNGKTHLAAAIRNRLHARGVPVAFVNWPSFLDYLRAAFSPENRGATGFAARFDTVARAPVLILDDVGAERSTEWVEEQLYKLLDTRTNGRMPTVITTNRDPDDLGHERIVSRLLNQWIARVVVNTATDYRRG